MTVSLTAGDLNIVRQINVFRAVEPPVFERLVASATPFIFKSGGTIFRQGDTADALFIVVDGWVKLYYITASGKEAVIYVFTKGESIAQAVAFTGQCYPATAEAVSDARIIRIPAVHVIKCIRDTPDIALVMIASTSFHLHNLMTQVAQLKVQSAMQRVADFLVSLCSSNNGSCTIALPYDKRLIAARLGIKPESLSRVFVTLRKAGVEVHALQVVVHDVNALRRIAEGRRRSHSKPVAVRSLVSAQAEI